MGTLRIKIKTKHVFSFRKLSMGHRNWDVLYLLLFLLFWNLRFEPMPWVILMQVRGPLFGMYWTRAMSMEQSRKEEKVEDAVDK